MVRESLSRLWLNVRPRRAAPAQVPRRGNSRDAPGRPFGNPAKRWSAGDRVAERTTRVLIADRDALKRNELRGALGSAGLLVVAEASDRSDAVYLAARCRPDVVVLDTALPPEGGVAAMPALADAALGAQVVLLARSPDVEAGLVALSRGAVGYLPRDMELASLARAVERVVAGEAAISRAMALQVIERLRELSRGYSGMRPIRSPLTTREWEVLDLLEGGASTAEIARQLVLTPETVRTHVQHILRKLRVHSRAEAVRFAEQARQRRD
jgi:DNA-binding NarL/FixJ family response regulator